MKFLCRRSSHYDKDGKDQSRKPHPDAFLAFLEPTGQPTDYYDHDKQDIVDDPEGKRWFIVLTWASVINLIREEGQVVIGKDDDFPDMLFIEFYDDYRE